jgi:hypothetical protein
MIKSSKTDFRAGIHGLQATRARAMASYLHMVVKNGRAKMIASSLAAECHGFARNWGGRNICLWIQDWIKNRKLPDSSKRGCHAKTFSFLSDPAVSAELRSWLRTNKWCMNPERLQEYSRVTIVTEEHRKYIDHINHVEMPNGLKQYLELQLFPRLHYATTNKGISSRTAMRWLHTNDFEYKAHAKGLYYDGHGRGDVVKDHQSWLHMMR